MPRSESAGIASAALLLALLAAPATSKAQVAVSDSLGAPVPFWILEAPDGRRAIAGANGVAPALSPASGPWSARRIGFRPAKDDDGDGVIVMSRLPVMLAPQEVRERTACTAQGVAARAPGAELDAIRAILLEGHDRLEIVGAGDFQTSFRVTETLVTENGRQLVGLEDTVPLFAQPSSVVYAPGRAVERVKGEWVLRPPRFVDLASAPFLAAHCLWIDDGDSQQTVIIRFEPAREIKART